MIEVETRRQASVTPFISDQISKSAHNKLSRTARAKTLRHSERRLSDSFLTKKEELLSKKKALQEALELNERGPL